MPPPKTAGHGTMAKIRQYDKEFPFLETNGLYAAPISGDGDCLFHSLSDQLYGHENCHHELRQRVVQHLRNHSSYFKAFIDVAPVRRVPRRKAAASSKADLEMHSESEIDRAFEQRLQRMQKSGVFGDNLEIQAFAREFGVDVKIYQREHAYVICDDNGSGNAGRASGEDRKVVHIAYHTWEHYSSIRNRGGPHSGPPNVYARQASPDALATAAEKAAQCVIMPWMVDIVEGALPHQETHKRISEVLKQFKGDVNAAVAHLLDEFEESETESVVEEAGYEAGEEAVKVGDMEGNSKAAPIEEHEPMEIYTMDEQQSRHLEEQPPIEKIGTTDDIYQQSFAQQPVQQTKQEAATIPRHEPTIFQQTMIGQQPFTGQHKELPPANQFIEEAAHEASTDFIAHMVQAPIAPMMPMRHMDIPEVAYMAPVAPMMPIAPMIHTSPIASMMPAAPMAPSQNCILAQEIIINEDDDDQSRIKRRKSPDGSPVSTVSGYSSSVHSSSSSDSDAFERRRKPASSNTSASSSPQPTRRSPRIQAKTSSSTTPVVAPSPKPKPPPKPRAPPKPKTAPKTKAPKKAPAAKRKAPGTGGRKRKDTGILQTVTVGIRELYV